MVIYEDIDEIVCRHYSDQGLMLRKVEDGTLWPDAVDVKPCPFTYEETDVPVPDEELTPEEALDIIMGGGAV